MQAVVAIILLSTSIIWILARFFGLRGLSSGTGCGKGCGCSGKARRKDSPEFLGHKQRYPPK
jgi:hypothetical protein